MGKVEIHCYGCSATVRGHEGRPGDDLRRDGWALAHGETYCPSCSGTRGLDAAAPIAAQPNGAADHPAVPGVSAAKDFLDYVQLRLMQSVFAGLVMIAVGLCVLLLTTSHHSSGPRADPRDVVIGVMLILGPLAIAASVWWLASVLPRARRGLVEQPLEVSLRANIARSKSGFDSASLWRSDGEHVQWIAAFGPSIWSRPFRFRTQMTPAWAYAIPARGNIVTVVFENGALVGRIRRSAATSAADLAPILPAAGSI